MVIRKYLLPILQTHDFEVKIIKSHQFLKFQIFLKGAFICALNRPKTDFGSVCFFSATMRRRDMIWRAIDARVSVADCTYLQNVEMISEKVSEAPQSRIDIKFRVLFKHQKWHWVTKIQVSKNQKVIFVMKNYNFLNWSKIYSDMF